MAKRWFYNGDVNIENGGWFYQESGHPDHVYAVEVIDSSSGLHMADNEFLISKGTIFIGDDIAVHKAALACCGHADGEKVTRHELIYAMNAYRGIEDVDYSYVRVGKVDKYSRYQLDDDKIDYQLRGNASLRKFVKSEFCI